MSTEQNKKQIYSSVPNGFDAFWLNDFVKNTQKETTLYIVSNGIELFQTAELLKYLNPNFEVLVFPAWDTVPYDRASPNINILSQRLETLSKLVLQSTVEHKRIVVTSIGAIIQKLPPKKIFLNSNKVLKIGSKFDFNGFLHYCAINGYTKVEQVMEPAEFALRGDIIDIFPSGANEPVRIDLFDDEVENLRTFNPLNQRSTGTLKEYTFLTANEVILNENTIKNFRLSYRENFGTNGLKDEIYEWISEGKKYIGMENWLPFFYDEPLPSLFDYIPNANIILGNNYDDALKAKNESIIDYYTARLEALNIASKTDDIVYP